MRRHTSLFCGSHSRSGLNTSGSGTQVGAIGWTGVITGLGTVTASGIVASLDTNHLFTLPIITVHRPFSFQKRASQASRSDYNLSRCFDRSGATGTV